MKRYFLLFFLGLCLSITISAQEKQELQLDIKQIEALFLSNNLELIAAKYDIDIADAAIIQAKLWENPNLSIGDLNLWTTKNQREGMEDASPLFGSFGQNTQFSIELSQLVQTANKRGKLIRREKVSKEIAIQDFEEVLRGLKAELRKSVYDLEYSQAYINVLTDQRQYFQQLIDSYKKQVQQGNIAKSELLRLQSAYLELEGEINETQEELNEQAKTLKILLNIDPWVDINILNTESSNKNPDSIVLANLMELANEARPDLKAQRLQGEFHKKSLAYEKSLRVPDITLSASYDRYGGVWKDFVGFGISVDLPFLNRNQGEIKAARASLDQSQYLIQQQQNIVRHEVATAYNSYLYSYNFYQKISEDSLFPEIDSMQQAYTRNLLNKNISMLEYIDFMDSYKANKQTYLNAQKKVNIQFEELQYTVGNEL